MAFAPSSPVTGTAQTGLTSPTYTIASDLAPDTNGKQYAVTALGGTQTGVIAHQSSSPFFVNMTRPKQMKTLSVVNPTTGQLKNVPTNTFKIITQKGAIPLAGQTPSKVNVTTTVSVPAGADSADSNSVRAALSFHFGVLSSSSAAIGDTIVSGLL